MVIILASEITIRTITATMAAGVRLGYATVVMEATQLVTSYNTEKEGKRCFATVAEESK